MRRASSFFLFPSLVILCVQASRADARDAPECRTFFFVRQARGGCTPIEYALLSTVTSTTREKDSWKRRDVKLHAHLSLAKSQKLEAHDKLQDPRTSSGSVCPLCILPILDLQSMAQVIVPRAGSVR